MSIPNCSERIFSPNYRSIDRWWPSTKKLWFCVPSFFFCTTPSFELVYIIYLACFYTELIRSHAHTLQRINHPLESTLSPHLIFDDAMNYLVWFSRYCRLIGFSFFPVVFFNHLQSFDHVAFTLCGIWRVNEAAATAIRPALITTFTAVKHKRKTTTTTTRRQRTQSWKLSTGAKRHVKFCGSDERIGALRISVFNQFDWIYGKNQITNVFMCFFWNEKEEGIKSGSFAFHPIHKYNIHMDGDR